MKFKIIKKIIILLIIFVSFISLVIIFLLGKITRNVETDNKNKGKIENNYEMIKDDNILLELKNNDEYYKIIDIVSKYVQCFYYEDVLHRALQLLDNTYIDDQNINDVSQLNKNYYDGYITYDPEEIKYIRKNNIAIFFVKGKFQTSELNKDYKEFNCTIKLDYNNYAFSIIPELCENTDGLYNEIKRNENNELKIITQEKERIANRYSSSYIVETNNDIEKSFYLLNSDYRKYKFNNNLELYKKYIDNKYINKESCMVEECTVYTNDTYNMYFCKDSEKNNFIIKENNVNSFEILLDNYTVITDEIKEYYNNLEERQKIIYNCENILESLKTGNYLYSYSHLKSEEKESKYNEINKYIAYLNKNSINDFKISDESMLDIDNNKYVYVSNIYNKNEKKQIIIEIALKQNMDFDITINIV